MLSGDDPEQQTIDKYRTMKAANESHAPSSSRWILDTENVELLRSDFSPDATRACDET